MMSEDAGATSLRRCGIREPLLMRNAVPSSGDYFYRVQELHTVSAMVGEGGTLAKATLATLAVR